LRLRYVSFLNFSNTNHQLGTGDNENVKNNSYYFIFALSDYIL